ncbi:hypothetical protein PISMIDRAFT_682376 [Pisolithus microcarpus 441]|uniref:Uncharacterized protein n=1 Tax=Pisolithus microcarpus 441 TaxID=765257 RepID=A0A0C9ZCX1_9AGAM|nr:hypothetical protein PISMIDRAFT_682376 [Pisolithus microcarpus 441]
MRLWGYSSTLSRRPGRLSRYPSSFCLRQHPLHRLPGDMHFYFLQPMIVTYTNSVGCADGSRVQTYVVL